MAANEAFRSAGRGDREAFATFYALTAGPVYGTVLGIVRNRSLAEEVTQETYVELWRLATRFDPDRGSAQRFAVTVGRRRAIDRVRSEQARRDREENAQRLSARLGERTNEPGGFEPSAGFDAHGVVEALRRLTKIEREAVTLAYYGGWTHREVASLLNIPEGTAKTRIRSGMIKLRNLLGGSSEHREVSR